MSHAVTIRGGAVTAPNWEHVCKRTAMLGWLASRRFAGKGQTALDIPDPIAFLEKANDPILADF